MRLVVSGLILICTLVSKIKMDGHWHSFWLYVLSLLVFLYLLLVAFSSLCICHYVNFYPCHGTYNALEQNMFEDFLERLKVIMRTGNDTLGLPVLDPFTMDQIPIAIDEDIIKLDALLTNVRVDGLSGYKVYNGDFKIVGLKLLLNASWPIIAANTSYAMKGKADNFEIYGSGNMKISPRDFFLYTEISFTLKDKHLQVKNIKLNISLKAFDFLATGLFDDEDLSELLSAIISDMVPQLIEDNHEAIVNAVIPLVKKKANSFLSTMTLTELMKLLGM